MLRNLLRHDDKTARPRSAPAPRGASRLRAAMVLLVGMIALGHPSPAAGQLGQERLGIRLIRPDGSETRAVISVPGRLHHGSPSWSADGKRLLFDAYLAGLQEPNLYTVDVDGKNLKELGSGAYPSWSPDGKQILFFSGLGQNPRISIMNADGGAGRELLSGGWPSWSPDGNEILFARSGTESGLWTAQPDGGNLRQLVLHQGVIFAPVWSRDAKRIAFASNAGGNFDIYTVSADGTDLRQLTTDPGMELFPCWSHDGKRIAFTRYQQDRADLYLIDADGSAEASLTSKSGFDIDPAWSPDGKWIAYSSQL